MDDRAIEQRPGFVAHHAMMAFVCGAAAISWGLWFAAAAVRGRDPMASALLVQLGTFGPCIAAVVVAWAIDRRRRAASRFPQWMAATAGMLAAGWACGLAARGLLSGGGTPARWMLLGMCFVLPGAIFFLARSGQSGARSLLYSLTSARGAGWLAAALLLMPALSLAGLGATALLSGQPMGALLKSAQSSATLHRFGAVFLGTMLYGGPLGEEAGWRGFALPRLQDRFDPLLASVLLAAIWGAWHVPLHLTGYYLSIYGSVAGGIVLQMISTVPLAVMFTWLYNRSGGNLLAMVLLHTMVNITSSVIPPGPGLFVIMPAAVTAMVLMDRMYRKRPKGEASAHETPCEEAVVR